MPRQKTQEELEREARWARVHISGDRGTVMPWSRKSGTMTGVGMRRESGGGKVRLEP